MSVQRDDDIARMQHYYDLRAPEYEAMYGFDNPERRAELDAVEALVRETFINRNVLEVACGSGYWTELLSSVAKSVTAIDTSRPMLEIARSRRYPHENVRFELTDAYNLGAVKGDFDASLAGFWMSHVPKRRMRDFLSGLCARLTPGSPVLFFDNNLVAGLGGELALVAGSADTFKKRSVGDGSEHVIVKNYFTKTELRELLSAYGTVTDVTMGHWYWSALYATK